VEHCDRIVTQIAKTILDSASASLKESPYGKELGWDTKTSVDRRGPGEPTGKRSTHPRGFLRMQIRHFCLESFSPKRENRVKTLTINWLQPANPINPGVAISGIPLKVPCQRVPRLGLTIAPPGKLRRFPELCPRSGRGNWNNRLAGLSLNNGPCRLLNECGEICPNTIGDAKHQFHCGIPQTSFDQTEHGFRHARPLGHGIIREMSALPLVLQEADYLFSDGLIMSDSRHAALWQKIPLDIYIAMVKYSASVKLMNLAFQANTPYFALRGTIFSNIGTQQSLTLNISSERLEPTTTHRRRTCK
jgi:hypothetical protein